MNPLTRVKSVQEFHENDTDQGVERTYLYYKTSSHHLQTEKQLARHKYALAYLLL